MRSTPPLSTTAARIRAPVFSELQARIDRLKGVELVPLQIGDTHLAPPEAARRALDAIDADDASLYRYGPTAGVAALREAFVRARRLDVDATEEVLVGNGGTHALYCAARAVLDPGDEVLMASPYWPLAPGIFTATGAIPVEVPLTQALYADPAFDAGAALAARVTARTKAIYVISPNNPDGKVLRAQDLARIADVARENNLWVFSDEVYADVIFDGEHASMADLPGMRERTVVLHSLSKSHALAGCRIGFVVAPAPVVSSARRVSTHTAFNVSVAMQRAAIAALSDEAFPKDAREAYRDARDVAAKALEGSGIRFHLADGATYLFLDFAPIFAELPPVDRPLLALLERGVDRGVLLAPGDAFGDAWHACARLCYTAVPLDRVKSGCERLLDAVEATRKGPLMSVNGVVMTASSAELDWLRNAGDDEIDDKIDAWFDEPRACHLEKHYAAVSYLLCGEPHGGNGPAAFIGNEEMGEAMEYEFAYGPGRMFDPAETRAIAVAIEARAGVEERLRDEALAEIYPFSTGGIDDAARKELREDVDRLRRHVKDAAERGCGLLVAVF